MSDAQNHSRWKTFTEEIEVAGDQLVKRVTELVAEGNVHSIRVKSQNDDVVLEVPLTAGAVVGGVFVLAAPWLVVLGALTGLLAKVRIEIVRTVEKAHEEADEAAQEQKAG